MPTTKTLSAFPNTLQRSTLQRSSDLRVQSSRAVIDQARGILILLYRIDADEALHMLWTWAKETESTLLVVARTLVDAVASHEERETWDRVVRERVEDALERLSIVSTAVRRTTPPRRRRRA